MVSPGKVIIRHCKSCKEELGRINYCNKCYKFSAIRLNKILLIIHNWNYKKIKSRDCIFCICEELDIEIQDIYKHPKNYILTNNGGK